VGTALFFVLLLGMSRLANAGTRDVLRAMDAGAVVDVVLNSNPAVPWCWSVVTLEHVVGDPASLRARRGTLSLFPGLAPAAGCASHRLLSSRDAPPTLAGDHRLVWNHEWRVDLAQLRALQAADCRARAWLQFGRVPFVANGRIADLRFENPLGGNFSAMSLDAAAVGTGGCPSNLTAWTPPRADVLGR
jgi:hypothetical protein